MKRALLLLCIALSTACAPAAEEVGPEATDDASYSAERLPMPKVAWSHATNQEHYFRFASWEDAAKWFEGLRGQRPYKGESVQQTALPHGDARYATVEKVTSEVWEAYRTLLPRETEGLESPPRVLLVERDDVNAYATHDWLCAPPDDDCLPHAIIVHTAALEEKASEPRTRGRPLAGLLAHELAHHVLKHALQSDGGMITRFHYASEKSPFGWQQKEEPAAIAAAEPWLVATALVGNFQLDELHGLPFPGSARDLALEEVRREETSKWPAECERARQSKNELIGLLKDNVDLDAVTTSWTPASRQALDASAARAADAYATCLKHTQRRPADVPGAESASVIVATANGYLDAVIKLTLHDNARLRAMDVSKIRFYTNEEQADDVSHAALLRSGDDPRALASFIGLYLMTPAARAACDGLLRIGKEPSYGSLHNFHHARCWRRWHSDKLLEFLKR